MGVSRNSPIFPSSAGVGFTPPERSPGRWLPAIRVFVDRFALGTLLAIALALVVLAKAELKVFGFVSDLAGDVLRPMAVLLAEPVAALRSGADRLGAVLAIESENARLREENRRLLAWQSEAIRLQVQNEALRQMLKMPALDQVPTWTTARIVADNGGAFVQTRLIDAGLDRDIRKGMAVTDGHGLVGRIVDVGERSSRVLLVTDFNSRLPVIIGDAREQAILEGTNGGLLELRFLPIDPKIAVGDRVVTSGRGGVIPPGLPIGEVAATGDRRVLVRPYVDWDRLDYVSVLTYAPIVSPEGTIPTDERAPQKRAMPSRSFGGPR